jgi:RNA polymerase sigma-70 factor (ECF subfamily)
MLADPAESPYDLALHEENRARVERALRQVPEPFRTTLILRDIEGFVCEEVAAMQGVSLGTVKSRLVRGRAYVKALLTAPKPHPSIAGPVSHPLPEAPGPGSRPTALAGIELSLREEAR